MDALEFIGFLVLSMHWPELMRCWQTTESLPIFRNCTYRTAYIRRIRLIASTVLILALGIFFLKNLTNYIFYLGIILIAVEHWLFIGATIHSNMINNRDKDILGEFVKVSVPHIIQQNEPLPTFIALLICYINESATFVWNFIDIFIMFFGVGLSSNFKVLNNELEQAIVRIEVNF